MDKSKNNHTQNYLEGFDPEKEFLFVDSEPPMPKTDPVVKKDPLKVISSKDDLYLEMVNQNTYTDIVDTILRYLKQIKGSPQDLVEILDFIKVKISDQMKK